MKPNKNEPFQTEKRKRLLNKTRHIGKHDSSYLTRKERIYKNWKNEMKGIKYEI